MRFPTPHDHNGRPCLPSHHPQSRPPWPSSPTPRCSRKPKPRTCGLRRHHSDPRASTGRRHPLIAILALAAAAVLTDARSITAIAEWAADAPQPVRAALGARRDAPDHYFGAGRGHDPPDAGASGCRRLGGHDRHVAGGPGGSWAAATGGRGRRQDAAGRRRAGRQVHLLAGDEAHHPTPTRCWRNARSTALPARFLDSSCC
jgi:hypothetical protein